MLDVVLDVGIVVALIAGISGLFIALLGHRKTDAETNSATVAAILLLINPLTARVAALELEVATLRKRVFQFRVGVGLLCGQLQALGAVPVWRPDEEKD